VCYHTPFWVVEGPAQPTRQGERARVKRTARAQASNRRAGQRPDRTSPIVATGTRAGGKSVLHPNRSLEAASEGRAVVQEDARMTPTWLRRSLRDQPAPQRSPCQSRVHSHSFSAYRKGPGDSVFIPTGWGKVPRFHRVAGVPGVSPNSACFRTTTRRLL